MTLLSQLAVESMMYTEGMDRALDRLKEAEAKGRASSNPYALKLMTEFVLPLAAVITTAVTDPQPGRLHAYAGLLAGMHLEAVAALAVRHVLNACMQERQNYRTLGYSLGRVIHREFVLKQFADAAPDLYHTLTRDFSRRMSQDERHRMTVFRLQAQKAGIELKEWGVGSRDQVGIYLLGQLADLGLIELGPLMTSPGSGAKGMKRQYRSITFTQQVLDVIGQIRGYVAVTQPAYGPCVEPPLPWTTLTDGGWHSEPMRKQHRYLVKTRPTARGALREADMSTVLAAVNAMQGTRWRVNARLLATVLDLAATTRTKLGEIETQEVPAKPDRLEFMIEGFDKGTLTEGQAAQMLTWKRSMAQWYEDRKRQTADYGRFYAATRQAQCFKDYPALYFVYFLDSRGRAYPQTYGVNPQGSDLQKALLEFADGEPLDTDAAIQHFLATGANCYGVDNLPLTGREQWVREHHAHILGIAADPLGATADWNAADSPLGFLAWCFEYAAWQADPVGFLSRLPANKDGSCNGLQHFSAMLRDSVGGDATNLVPHSEKQDVYLRAATRTQARLDALPDPSPVEIKWKQHGIQRLLAKRTVMTTPYGVTPRGATDYIVKDYLEASAGQGVFDKPTHREAAKAVMAHLWPAIGEVVVKSREAMDWLSASGKAIARHIKGSDDPVICWRTPSGFVAAQTYFRTDLHRIPTFLHGACRVRVVVENDTPHVVKHGTGLAPNFVHSMDAAHMHRVIARASAEGIHAFSMIHDSYGTHARHAARLNHIIRDEFVRMYEEHDPLAALRDRYPFLPPPPAQGGLGLAAVRDSEFFFS